VEASHSDNRTASRGAIVFPSAPRQGCKASLRDGAKSCAALDRDPASRKSLPRNEAVQVYSVRKCELRIGL